MTAPPTAPVRNWLDRGLHLPFEKPICAGARLRWRASGVADVVLPPLQGFGSQGHYIVPLKSIAETFGLGPRDRMLATRIHAERCGTPLAIERLADIVDREHDPDSAGTLPRYEKRHREALARALAALDRVFPGAAKAIDAGRYQLGASGAATLEGTGLNAAQLAERVDLWAKASAAHEPARIVAVRTFAHALAVWAKASAWFDAPRIGEVAQRAMFCATRALKHVEMFPKFETDPAAALGDPNHNPLRLHDRAILAGWYLDGWEAPARVWSEIADDAAPGVRERAAREIQRLAPTLPVDPEAMPPAPPAASEEIGKLYCAPTAFDRATGLRGTSIKANVDWLSGMPVEEAMQRSAAIRGGGR